MKAKLIQKKATIGGSNVFDILVRYILKHAMKMNWNQNQSLANESKQCNCADSHPKWARNNAIVACDIDMHVKCELFPKIEQLANAWH